MTARPSLWDDPSCGVVDCPCPHDPVWTPSNQPCERGWTTPRPGATTPGVRTAVGAVVAKPSEPGDDGVQRCPTCKAHAERAKAGAGREAT